MDCRPIDTFGNMRKFLQLFLLVFWCFPGFGQMEVSQEELDLLISRGNHPGMRTATAGRYGLQVRSTLLQYPEDFPGLSHLYIPGSADSGLHYVLTDEVVLAHAYQEEAEVVVARQEYGRFKSLFWESARELRRMPMEDYWEFKEFSDLRVLVPMKRPDRYHWTKVETGQVTRYFFSPIERSTPAFTGYLEVDAAGSWKSWRGKLARDQHLKLLDSLVVELQFKEGKPTQWDYHFHYKVLVYQGRVDATLQEFGSAEVPPIYPGIRFTLPDSAYNQPFSAELQSWHHAAQEEAAHIKPYTRLLERLNRPAQLASGLFFTSLVQENSRYTLYWPGLYKAYGYNTVEGNYLAIRPELTLYRYDAEWKILPQFRWSGGENHFRPSVKVEWEPFTRNKQKWWAEGGANVVHFNPDVPILPLYNTFYTLFLGRNFAKLYQKEFVAGGYSLETPIGWKAQFSASWEQRTPLSDGHYFSFLHDELWRFTPNAPPPNQLENLSLQGQHRALLLEAELVHQFGVRYARLGKRLVQMGEPHLKVGLNTKAGLNLGAAYAPSLKLEAFGEWFQYSYYGRTDMELRGGGFAVSPVAFADFKHFNGVQTLFLQQKFNGGKPRRQFRTMPYYDFSTAQHWLELHAEHNFQGSVLGNFQPFATWRWQLSVGANLLYQPERSFGELFLGIDNVFRIVRLEFAYPLVDYQGLLNNFRLGISIDFHFYHDKLKR